MITGANSAEEAFQLYTTSKNIFRQGAFNLRKFKTNRADLQRRINLSKGTPGSSLAADLDLKVLGVSWNPSNDLLLFELSSLLSVVDKLQPTRRNVVRLIGRFYDPIGFLAPVIIKYKILLQKLCQTKVGWDSELPEVLLKEWNSLLTELREATPISIPRRYDYSVEQACSYSLCRIRSGQEGSVHCLKDASCPTQDSNYTPPKIAFCSFTLLAYLVRSK